MKCIILAGGFAKRLWPLTLHQSKILIEINGKPLLTYIMEKLDAIGGIDEIFISTNKRFEKDFENWLENNHFSKKIKLVVEPTTHEDEKFGAINAINYVVEQAKIEDDLMVLGGDNLDDLDIEEFIKFFKSKNAPITVVFDVGNRELAKKYGIVALDKDKIVDFVEKPEEPKSTLANTCKQIFPKSTLHLFKEYLSSGNPKDAPGYFLQWLYKKTPVYAFIFKGHWFDVGCKESLHAAEEWVKGKKITSALISIR